MNEIQNLFERTEKKYIVTREQEKFLLDLAGERLVEDRYPRGTIRSLYLDTPDFRLIRASIEKPAYKEKLRLRAYCLPDDDSPVFLELKKKYNGVVYKRRECMTLAQAEAFMQDGEPPADTQIAHEILWAFRFYPELKPRMFIRYDRLALKGAAEQDLRITFDSNLLYRDTRLDLRQETACRRLLGWEKRIMEIKALDAMPLWLCDALDRAEIYPSTFSKYGTAYTETRTGAVAAKGGNDCA